MHTDNAAPTSPSKNKTTHEKVADAEKSDSAGKIAKNARIALLTTPAHKAAMLAAADEAGQSITTYVMRAAIAGGMVRP